MFFCCILRKRKKNAVFQLSKLLCIWLLSTSQDPICFSLAPVVHYTKLLSTNRVAVSTYQRYNISKLVFNRHSSQLVLARRRSPPVMGTNVYANGSFGSQTTSTETAYMYGTSRYQPYIRNKFLLKTHVLRYRLQNKCVLSQISHITFQYHMYGQHIGTLSVQTSQGIVWSKTGNQGNVWYDSGDVVIGGNTFDVVYDQMWGIKGSRRSQICTLFRNVPTTPTESAIGTSTVPPLLTSSTTICHPTIHPKVAGIVSKSPFLWSSISTSGYDDQKCPTCTTKKSTSCLKTASDSEELRSRVLTGRFTTLSMKDQCSNAIGQNEPLGCCTDVCVLYTCTNACVV